MSGCVWYFAATLVRALWQWILKLLDSSYDSFLIWWQEGRNECTTCSWLAIYLRDEADAVEADAVEADAVEADAAEADAAQEADAMAEEVWNPAEWHTSSWDTSTCLVSPSFLQ